MLKVLCGLVMIRVDELEVKGSRIFWILEKGTEGLNSVCSRMESLKSG